MNNSSIRSRIVINFGAVMIVTIIILELLFSVFVKNYYYGGVMQILRDRVSLTASFLNRSNNYLSVEEKSTFLLENIVSAYDSKFLIQIIDKDRVMIKDSSDFYESRTIRTPDVEAAFSNQQLIYEARNGKTGERTFSTASPLTKFNQIDGVIRYTVSLEKVDHEVQKYIMAGWMLGFLVITFFIVMALIVSKSIVNPIHKLNLLARAMAEGDFSQETPKIYNDEIGQLSDSLNFMAREIVKSEKIKKDFISSISHELRTPLTSIKGWSETLLMGDIDKKGEVAMGLRIISSETDRLKDMVEELLDFSRLESRSMKVSKKLVNPKDTLREVYRQFLPRDKSITLNIELIGSDTMILADENRIKQVFINLLANAFKFTSPGGEINLRAEGFEERIVITIADNGIGMEPEEIGKVRDKFYKVSQSSPGSGLGLSIVDEILQMHDAVMMIQSQPGQGTAVTIILPAAPDPLELPPPV